MSRYLSRGNLVRVRNSSPTRFIRTATGAANPLSNSTVPLSLLNCWSLNYSDMEEGAFTGAKRTGKAGMFELANTGVLLLDEVGDMPMALQAKLLRVLQERSLVRLGGSKTIDLDIRVIAATNKELLTQVRQGRFREDLYYRLSVVPIELKPYGSVGRTFRYWPGTFVSCIGVNTEKRPNSPQTPWQS